jgi:hypothetical protein
MSNNEITREINAAIGAHGAWKLKLRTAISTGRSEVDPADVRCDDKCAFGQWLYGETIDQATRDGKPYEVVKRLHADFHKCASSVLTQATAGNDRDARTLFEGEFDERSRILVVALNKWKRELTFG